MNNTIIPKNISLLFSLLLLLLAIPFHSCSMNKEVSLQEQSPLQFLPTEILSKIVISCNPAGRSRLVCACTWLNQLLSLDKLTEWLAWDTELSQGECIKIITHCAQEGCILPHNLSSNNHYEEVLHDIIYFFTNYEGADLSLSEVVAYMEQKPENQDALNAKICNAIVNVKDIIGDKLSAPFNITSKSTGVTNVVLFFIAQNVNLNAQDYCGETLLHMMCRNTYYAWLHYSEVVKQISTIELLLKYKADPNVKDARYDAIPLHYLLDWYEYFRTDRRINATAITIAKLLLTYGADPNSLTRASGYDNVSATALSCACNHNDIEMAELLLAHGADPDIALENYPSPLQSAYKHNNEGLVQLIAQHRRGISSLQDLYYW